MYSASTGTCGVLRRGHPQHPTVPPPSPPPLPKKESASIRKTMRSDSFAGLIIHGFTSSKSRSHLVYVADLARDQHRRGGRVVVAHPWNWNVLTTWPIQSVLTEAPFVCARQRKKGILTNCADTARLVGRSRCCQSPISQSLVQSSLANLFVSHEECLWNVSVQEDSVDSCDPPDVEEATALSSEEDDAIREWRQEFPEQTRHAISRIHARKD